MKTTALLVLAGFIIAVNGQGKDFSIDADLARNDRFKFPLQIVLFHEMLENPVMKTRQQECSTSIPE